MAQDHIKPLASAKNRTYKAIHYRNLTIMRQKILLKSYNTKRTNTVLMTL